MSSRATESILFVDDDPRARRAFVRTLKGTPYRVDLAASGVEAEELVKAGGYSVIATDLRLPDEDGIGVIERLRRLQPHASFLLVTGADHLTLPADSEAAEAIAQIITKPWGRDELRQAVARAVELFHDHRANAYLEMAAWTDPEATYRVLVVEDVDDSEPSAARALGDDLAFDTVSVGRLADGLRRMEIEIFDAVVVDLNLPDARGLTAVARVQTQRARMPLVVVSDSDDDVLAIKAVQIGAQDCMPRSHLDGSALARAVRFAIERTKAQERWVYLANYDQLTGLPNRTMFNERLAQAVARHDTRHGSVGLLFLDLDRFKWINDTYGHEQGDALLRQVATRLRGCLRGSEMVARLGGDEFTVILERIRGVEDAASAARRVLDVFAAPFEIDGRTVLVTTSVGVALDPIGGDVDDLIRAADTAMYNAKHAGRNTFCLARDNLHRGGEALRSGADLARALEEDQFELRYMPRAALADGSITGVEALLRWRHPNHGLLLPAEFLPLLNETGLIRPVGEWAMRQVCADAALWDAAELPMLQLAVNVSARQLADGECTRQLKVILDETGVEPDRIEIELTHRVLTDGGEAAQQATSRLHALGVRLSVDDFGAGFPDVEDLRRFHIRLVKLDRIVTAQIIADPDYARYTALMVELSHQLGLGVVAEGVERADQLKALRGYGCDAVEGYFVARPMTANELLRWLPLAKLAA